MANAALRAAGQVADLDHRSYRTRGLSQLPARHLGSKAAAMARAGKPNATAKRNERIRRINAEVEAAGFARRSEARRLIEMAKFTEAEEAFSKEAWRRVKLDMQEILAASLLAGDLEDILDGAALLLVCRDVNHSSNDIESLAAGALLADVMRALGPGWLSQVVGERLWLICAEREASICVGPGFVATEDFIHSDVVARVAKILGFGSVLGFVHPEHQPNLLEVLEAEPAFQELKCEWRERAPAAADFARRP
jgi:hypothetical protein